jgi:hypothetical protein
MFGGVSGACFFEASFFNQKQNTLFCKGKQEIGASG